MKVGTICGFIRAEYFTVEIVSTGLRPTLSDIKNLEISNVGINLCFIENNTNTTIYLYYGNPSAENKSNGDKVFIFFEDFEDGDINIIYLAQSFANLTG